MSKKKKSLTKAAEKIVRQSKQPRFEGEKNQTGGWMQTFRWAKDATQNEPPYSTDSRKRDTWLREFWKQEPHLSGVLSSVVSIDKNRGWTLTGGRNTVTYYSDLLYRAENGAGWRRYAGKQSLSYYTADMGFVSETERDGIPGRLVNLYSTDPARCRLLGGVNNRLNYYPSSGGHQEWVSNELVDVGGSVVQAPADYFRAASMISTNEKYNDLGYCAVSRCLKLAQIMIAVVCYDKEKLGAQAPQGLLLLQNIGPEQWSDAMRTNKALLKGKDKEWFNNVVVLAGQDPVAPPNASLVALSSLPESFNRENFIEYLMYGYALCFGYDSGEFWPKMRAGGIGSSETAVQHQKATGKGGLEFALEYQTQLQAQLPSSIHFEFEQRDDAGELLDADVKKKKAEWIQELYDTGLKEGASLITREEARSLLAQSGLIPDEWTELDEEVTASDSKRTTMQLLRDEAKQSPYVQNQARINPSEPIVQYKWRSYTEPTQTVLFESGWDMMKRSLWSVNKKRATLYENEALDFEITDEDVDRVIDESPPLMEELLEATAV